MKKAAFRVLTALLFCVLLTTTAFADMGPKPSVQISIDGLAGRECYATLLSREKSTGPYSASHLDGSYLTGAEKDAYSAFSNYEDPDGLWFLGQVFSAAGGSFTWGYYPPDEFRVLLYFPDTGELAAGELLSCYAFDSCYRGTYVPGSGGAAGSLSGFDRTNGFQKQILPFLARLALTILIELLIAGLFGYWNRHALRVILWTNLTTQILLNLVLALFVYYCGSAGFFLIPLYLILELIVFAAEAAVYKHELAGGHPVLYALAANAASFLAGLGLAELLPSLF